MAYKLMLPVLSIDQADMGDSNLIQAMKKKYQLDMCGNWHHHCRNIFLLDMNHKWICLYEMFDQLHMEYKNLNPHCLDNTLQDKTGK